jgi:hypothetical protein
MPGGAPASQFDTMPTAEAGQDVPITLTPQPEFSSKQLYPSAFGRHFDR